MPVPSLSVMVVEDDAEACVTLCNLIGLAYPSLVIHAVDNGRSALDCFSLHAPDLIIADFQMPVMDGISMAAEMKSLNSDVVIVALTCSTDANSMLRCIEIGIDHYLLKPLEGEKLYAVIDKRIELKSAIVQRRESEEALLASEERYRKLVEQMRDGLVTVDISFAVTYANRPFLEMVHRSADQLIGRSLLEVLAIPELSEQKEKRKLGLSSSYDLEITRKDGAVTFLAASGAPLLDRNGAFVGSIAVFTDITKRKRAEQEILRSHELLLKLAARTEAAREDERLKISREVHDELGQSLTALKFDIVSLRKNDRLSAAQVAKLSGMEKMVSATIGSVRHIVGQLRPRLLDDLGLHAAIEWQAGDFAKRTGISCRLELCEFPELSTDCAITVIRILQEALTNVVRHAEATEVAITLVREADFLVFSIADNGKGVSDHALLGSDTFGLMGMRERARLCRGTFHICSSPGRGLTIRLQIALHKSEEG